jgi:predicted nuclease of restriction endonuclease-like (RecB) superfamily
MRESGEIKMIQSEYSKAIIDIKNAVLQSRYKAATLANRELLLLYFSIGEYISQNTRNNNWGKGAIEFISIQLQNELPGLRGFSATNLKNMRIFYEEWKDYIPIDLLMQPIAGIGLEHDSEIRQLATDELENQGNTIRQLPTADFDEPNKSEKNNQEIIIRQLPTAELKIDTIELFFKVGFTLHREIIRHSNNTEERLFYIEQSALGSWNVEKLKYNLKSNLFHHKGKLKNNFETTIANADFRHKAINSFKDELLLEFINITDPNEEPDERVLEQSIVNNIKKFIMAIGNDFCFIGNQYRLLVDEEEFFIDLLFFNRKLQSLVAIELKKGKFKAEYAGKMNFYLSALDEYVKQPYENSSIGIILCKEKSNTIVEFAFRDTSKPMGVMIYKNDKELPEKYKNILPNAEDLKKLL